MLAEARRAPDEARTPMVLIHGFTDTPRTWDPLIPRLAERHRLLAPALVGHSGGDPVPADAEGPRQALVDGVERAMERAGFETAHLVGSSLGGWLALELAARRRARSVIALAPGGGWEHGGRVIKQTMRRFMRVHRVSPIGARYAEHLVARPRLRKLVLRDFVARGERVPPATAAAMLRGAADCEIFEAWSEATTNGSFRTDLGPLDVPVRIAWGTHDRILPKRGCSEHFLEAVPDADWVDLPGLGHLPQHDDPELVARTVLEVTASAR